MAANVSLHILILLAISCPIQCQFPFNDLKAVHDIVLDTVQIAPTTCIAILRPLNENPQQKSAIDRLTRQFAIEQSSKHGNRRPSVMSYTMEMYEKIYMDPNHRKRDACFYGATIVMVSESTNEQLAYLSADSYKFERMFWVLFANGSDYATLLQNVRIRISTRLWIAQPNGNGLFSLTEIGMFGTDLRPLTEGKWAENGGLSYPGKDFYGKMTGHTLNVGTLYDPQYVITVRGTNGTITSVKGFYGDVWNDLQEILKFNSVFVTPKDYTFGTYTANGNWTGLYGMLVRNEVDVLLGAMTISQARHQIADFLHTIHKTKFKIFYKKEAEINDWLKVFRPLDYPVWIALVIWIIVGGTVAYLVEKHVQHSHNTSWVNCMYFVLRTLCNQGFDQVPKPWPLRIFLLTAYLHATVIVTSYSASLISVLTVKTPVEPFTGLRNILATDYKLTLNSNSSDFDFFANTNDPFHRKIYEKSVIKNKIFRGYVMAMEAACRNEKTAFFGTLTEASVYYRIWKTSCVLLPLKSEISPVYKTIAVAKHSQYREILNRRLFRMIEHGMVNKHKRRYLQDAFETSFENEIGIGLVDIGALFIYLLILHALSAGIFCIEVLFRQ